MRTRLLFIALLLVTSHSYCQVAQWIIRPVYDSIYFAEGTDLIVTDSADKQIFWKSNGKRLFESNETIHPFSEGIAVATEAYSNKINGFYDVNGNYTKLSDSVFTAHDDTPLFNDGYLLVSTKNGYYYVDRQGNMDERKLDAYPYSNGYARIVRYKDPTNPNKGTVQVLINQNKTEVPLRYDRILEAADLEFISSVNDEGKAVVITKKRGMFFLNTNTMMLEPIKNNNSNNQYKAKDGPSNFKGIYAYVGTDRKDTLTVYFDKNWIPQTFKYHSGNNNTKTVSVNKKNNNLMKGKLRAFGTKDDETPLKTLYDGHLYGISANGITVLPPQFQQITSCFDHNAFVSIKGKMGMLKVTEDTEISIIINDDKDINFEHNTYDSKIKIDIPHEWSPKEVKVNTNPKSGMSIDKRGGTSQETLSGHRIEYGCTFEIPKDIDEKDVFSYYLQIVYDGLTLPDIEKELTMRYLKYYKITLGEEEKNSDVDYITIPYDIDVSVYTEKPTYLDVSVLPDSLNVETIKSTINTGVLKFPKTALQNGDNHIVVELQEPGCPPIQSLYTLNYTPPTKKTMYKPAVKIKKEEPKKEYIFSDDF